ALSQLRQAVDGALWLFDFGISSGARRSMSRGWDSHPGKVAAELRPTDHFSSFCAATASRFTRLFLKRLFRQARSPGSSCPAGVRSVASRAAQTAAIAATGTGTTDS